VIAEILGGCVEAEERMELPIVSECVLTEGFKFYDFVESYPSITDCMISRIDGINILQKPLIFDLEIRDNRTAYSGLGNDQVHISRKISNWGELILNGRAVVQFPGPGCLGLLLYNSYSIASA
jgi:hypothetical protein